MNTDITNSFTAADAIPIKILLDDNLTKSIRMGTIPPIHAQLIPTNKCNLNCNYCSCRKRDRNLEMDFEMAKKVIDKLKDLGCKAVTITGGGSPLLYSHIKELIDYFFIKDIKIGLVTNGLLLGKQQNLHKVAWCRISHADDRDFGTEYKAMLSEVVMANSDVDWAFSYVLSPVPNFPLIGKIVNFANEYNFTHVRIVADILNNDKIDVMQAKQYLLASEIDDSKVVYQGRNNPSRGGNCYICYLKPTITPDFRIGGCCGFQYSLDPPSLDLPNELCIGSALELDKIYSGVQKPFNGSICKKCYYMNYNTILTGLMSKNIKHKEFI